MRRAVMSFLGVLLAVQIGISYSGFFCPIHCHAADQKILESHLGLSLKDCHCFIMSFYPAVIFCEWFHGEMSGAAPATAEYLPLTVEAARIDHPPLFL